MHQNKHSYLLAIERGTEEAIVRFVQPKTNLDDSKAQLMGELLTDFLDSGEAGHLTIDLSNVRYLTSSALGVCVKLHKQAMAKGGHVTFRNMSDMVHEIFEVTQLTRILDIREPNNRDSGCPASTVPEPQHVDALPRVREREE